MKITENQIEEIAELMECGDTVYFHKITGEIESHPDLDSPYIELEFWQEIIDKTNNDIENYITFYPNASGDQFKLMSKFAELVRDNNLQQRLFNSLSMKHPFRNYKDVIDRSNHRDKWFKFKKEAYIEMVKDQLELNSDDDE